jgi:peptidylprolyl isomerase
VTRRLLLACSLALLSVAFAAAGCGDDDEQETAATATATATATETAAPAGPADVEALKADISKDLSEKPEIPKPEGTPPEELVVEDIVVGKGKSVRETDTVSAQYVGVSWSTGEQFDASWDGGSPIDFSLDQVIPGWTQGLQGMKPGGRRLLVIPPDLGYGEAGSPPAIGPNETLIFVVDLVAIR